MEWLPWILIALGTLLRLRQYLFDRSLWLDEAFLALDITHDTFHRLWRPLQHGQAAPAGFLFIEKAVIVSLGNSEYTFRLVPLLAGVAALFLFYQVAKASVSSSVVPVALGLFAISRPLIYYSTETKPYSLDVLVAVALYAIAMPMDDLNWNRKRLFWIGIVGALCIWFSYTTVFILGGIGLTLAFLSLYRKDWSAVRFLFPPFLLWAAIFGVYYWLLIRHWEHNTDFVNYWRQAFMPFPPVSFHDVTWYTNTLFDVFAYPAGIAATGLAVALFFIGCRSLYLRRTTRFFFLVTPIALALAASAIHRYPFTGRLILFLTPALILLVSEGACYLLKFCSSSLVQIALLAALFFTPTFSAFYHFIRPDTHEEIKPAINYIRAHDEPGDLLYLYNPSSFAFQYYNERDALKGLTVVLGQDSTSNWNADAADLSRLRGHRRVWILFSHVRSTGGVNEEALFLYLLNQMGKQDASFQAPGAAAYLYDLK